MIYLPTINSFIRFFNASPGSPALDIYVNGDLTFRKLAYKRISKYLPVGPETLHIQIFSAGTNTNPLVDTNIDVPASERITYAIIGTSSDMRLLPITFNVAPTDTPKTLVRFANLSPNAPGLDLIISDSVRINDIGYGQVSNFQSVNPNTYNVQLRLSGNEETIYNENLKFIQGQAYTINALGMVGDNPPVELVSYKDQIPSLNPQDKKKDVKEKVVTNDNIKIVFSYE